MRVSTTSNPTRWGHEKLRNRFSPEGGGWRGTGEDQAEVIGGKNPTRRATGAGELLELPLEVTISEYVPLPTFPQEGMSVSTMKA